MRNLPDWPVLARCLKAWGDWRCWRCRLQGLRPGERVPERAERVRRSLQVHHRDRDRTNNALYNLEVVCARCHLNTHRGERFGRRVVVGQLRLAIALSATRPAMPSTTPLLTPLRLPLKALSPDREACLQESVPPAVDLEQLTLIEVVTTRSSAGGV